MKIKKINKRFHILQQYYAKRFELLKEKLDKLVKISKLENEEIFEKTDNKDDSFGVEKLEFEKNRCAALWMSLGDFDWK